MIRSFLFLASSALYLASAASGELIQLWPDKVPGFADDYTHKPHTVVDPMRVSETSRAFMRVFPADPKTSTGHALAIFPGGGYGILAHKHEGEDVAKFFNSKGITCFVVNYRVSRKGENPGYRFPGPLLDARQAIRHIRKNAEKYKIDRNKVGVLGFSAGGHLASMCATRYVDKLKGDPTSDISVRPDFAAMIYPVISMVSDYSHGGSKKKLLGANPTKKEMVAANWPNLLEKFIKRITP